MRLDIDLRLLDAAGMERSGIGRYAVEVTRHLAGVRPGWRLTAHCDRPELFAGAAVRTRSTPWPTHHAAGRVMWQHAGSFAGARPRPDVWFSPAYVLPAWWRGPSVVTIHDLTFLLDPSRYRGRLNARYASAATRWSARRASRVLCGAHDTARLLETRLGVAAGRVVVAPYGVSAPFLRTERGTREPFLLFVGVLEARKGIEVLHAALATVRARHPEVRLVLAGRPGWGTKDVLARLSADPAVSVVRDPSDAMIADLYARATALVYPSRMEGFGLPVAEAMAVGCPVVASDLAVIREFAGDALAYAPPGNTGALAIAIASVLDDGAAAEARAHSAIPRARGLTWEATAEATAQAIEASL